MRLLSAAVKLNPADEADHDAITLMQCSRPFMVLGELMEATSVRGNRDGTINVTVKPAGERT